MAFATPGFTVKSIPYWMSDFTKYKKNQIYLKQCPVLVQIRSCVEALSTEQRRKNRTQFAFEHQVRSVVNLIPIVSHVKVKVHVKENDESQEDIFHTPDLCRTTTCNNKIRMDGVLKLAPNKNYRETMPGLCFDLLISEFQGEAVGFDIPRNLETWHIKGPIKDMKQNVLNVDGVIEYCQPFERSDEFNESQTDLDGRFQKVLEPFY